MRVRSSSLAFLFVFVLPLAACGGGGGAGATPEDSGQGPNPPTLLATLKAALLGSNETTVTDPGARATALLEILSDGTLEYAVTGEAPWITDVTGMHIHRGTAGVDGPIEVDLLDGITFDTNTATASGSKTIAQALAAEITTSPEEFYVNVHTNVAVNGFVRAQLAPLGTVAWHAVLRGEEEVPVADADAHGAVSFGLQPDRTVSWVLAMGSDPIQSITGAHVHAGSAGVNGGVLVDLDVGSATLDVAENKLSGERSVDLPIATRICANLAGFYANVHTSASPNGLARGQLTDRIEDLWCTLSGDQVVPSSPMPSARGGLTMRLFDFDKGLVHLAVPPAQGIGDLTIASIRGGVLGQASGVILIDLKADPQYSVSGPTGSSEGAIDLDQALYTRLLASPAGFYAQFATADATFGLVRGQLSRSPAVFAANLSGAEEQTPVDPGANGALQVVFDGMFHASFAIQMGSPSAADVTEGHVHDGAAMLTGPAVLDLVGGENVQVAGSFLTGEAPFTGRAFARIIAAPELFHGDVHTAPAPDGVARGQLSRVDDSLPPSGLLYSTPVVYTEHVAIPPNTPTSTGGAISSYVVSPPLPPGLMLNATTGVISGTPVTTTGGQNHVVTASNAVGSTMATLHITVLPAMPTNLAYASPVTYAVGQAIAPNVPSNQGGTITSYSVSPALPNGLSLNTGTGVITGTPTTQQAQMSYTVTGSNSAGMTTANVLITINQTLQPPSNLSYSTPVTYLTGYTISPNSPTVTGTVTMWSVSPALPAGLALDASTGVISGTPTQVTTAANYTVTAANAAGSTTATINITVNLGAPSNLTYSNDPNFGYVTGGQFATMNPSWVGGAVSSWSISPSLPAGISLSPTTGVISGTPTQQTSQTNYTVTATNAAGMTTATITITIYP